MPDQPPQVLQPVAPEAALPPPSGAPAGWGQSTQQPAWSQPAPGAPAWGQQPQQTGLSQSSVNAKWRRRREDFLEEALPLLPPGTVVRQVLVGQSRSHFGLALLNRIPYLWILFLPVTIPRWFTNRLRLLAVADDAIYLVQFSRVAGIT